MKTSDLRSQIIRNARSNSLDRATSLLAQYTEQMPDGHSDVSLLQGRLIKERAKNASGGEAATKYGEAADCYEAAAVPGNSSYPLINAATLAMLAGEERRAHALAQRVLDVLDDDPEEGETPYWHAATRAEALLVLGREVDARAAMSGAISHSTQAWEDHAATIGQFGLICAERGYSSAWLDRYRPPRSIQFAGIMHMPIDVPDLPKRIAEELERENVGFGYGALAAGSDILIAEALLERGAELHVVLPCSLESFQAQSVDAFDPIWRPRFDRLLAEATSVDVLEENSVPDREAVKWAEKIALGLAIYNANQLQSEALTFNIQPPERIAQKELGPVRHIHLLAPQIARGERKEIAAKGRFGISLATRDAKKKIETVQFDDIESAWTAAQECIEAGGVAVPDLSFSAGDNEQQNTVSKEQSAQMSARTKSLLDIAEQSQILTSTAFAFALFAENLGVKIETLGEVRSAVGRFPAFSLAKKIS